MSVKCKQCGENNCPHITVKSYTPVIKVVIPFIVTKQGRREFGTGSISTQNLLMIADIPALDFSKELPVFCKETVDSVDLLNRTGEKPLHWQRPTDGSRISEASSWLSLPNDNSMPDAILIGERINPHIAKSHESGVVLSERPHSIIGNFEIYQLTITNVLIDGCTVCGTFLDDKDVQLYRNRCPNHACPEHQKTTSPFSIIDGQHRTMSLFNSRLETKEVGISILLQRAIAPSSIGYSLEDQAMIFNQVNTESSSLNEIHKTWLKRFFGEWSRMPNNDSHAFDLLASLGSPARSGGRSEWPPYVKYHPKKGGGGNSKFRIESTRATDAGSGMIDDAASMSSIMDSVRDASNISRRAEYVIMNDWLSAAHDVYPTQFGLPGSVGFLDNKRTFEAFLRIFNLVKENASICPGFTGNWNYDDFVRSFSQHAIPFASGNWSKFLRSGEEPWKEFYNILKLMWSNSTGPTLPTAPTWYTLHSGGSCPDWLSYIELTPDPVDDFLPSTYCDPSSRVDPAGTLSTSNNRAIVTPSDIVSWNRPRNVASGPDIYYRIYDIYGSEGPWLNIQGGLRAQPVTSDDRHTELTIKAKKLEDELTSRSGIMWDLKITYANVTGETILIAGFITS
jgi:hypothetical protein